MGQTFSARNYQWKLDKKPNIVWLIDAVFFFQKEHCLTSWLYYEGRLSKGYTGYDLVEEFKYEKVDRRFIDDC